MKAAKLSYVRRKKLQRADGRKMSGMAATHLKINGSWATQGAGCAAWAH
jgi:hypothetical protein